MNFQNTPAFAKQLDAEDPLRSFRNEFLIPQHKGNDAIYFLGNSLGLQPRRTKTAINNVLKQWSTWGVEAFFKGHKPWLQFHQQLTSALSKIVGALPHEVVVMNQLTVNLHLMLASFYQPSGKRNKILCEAKAFPSDQYMLYSHVKQRGLKPDEVIVEVQPREGEVLVCEEDILAAIEKYKDELTLVFWGGVNYYTGQVFDMKTLSKAAQSVGAKVGFDLAHAAGNVPLQLHDWNVDFACWCSYKYLNSGPGGIGGAFVHERHHRNENLNRFAGWWGNKKETQFLMEKEFVPEASAEGWQVSTPSPILYASHKAALNVFEEAGFANLLLKNERLNEYLRFVLSEVSTGLPNDSFKIFTPGTKEERGCQISLSVKNGKKVFEYLSNNGVFADWREPDVIRIAPVGLYNSFEEVWQFGQCLKAAVLTFAA
ncbi:kynureninase [Flavisolibacter ginsenosidimutans]|uniref:Kynureninase n=1 Tax=Flavisolibacter ginsenosidimutans TaxID=661481 RepID=A0A5B8UES9_9BACT|nr:kynureninase [Flavisolibacter ginsenosidimutans]QEC55157.1 kynureninase [Flavisolibacter ginsenosidimutans]